MLTVRGRRPGRRPTRTQVNDVGFFAHARRRRRQERPDRLDAGRRSTSRSRPRAPSWTRPRSSSPSSPARGLRRPDQGLRRRPARTWSRAASCRPTSRRRSRTCCPTSTSRARRRPALEFLSPVKGPALEQITVEVGSGHPHAPRTAPRSTTRTSRSRPSSSACRAGRRQRMAATDGRAVRGDRATPARDRRPAAGRRRERTQPVPVLVLPARRGHLRRALPGPDVRVVLLQPDPLDPLRLRSSSASTTSSVLPGAGPGQGPAATR